MINFIKNIRSLHGPSTSFDYAQTKSLGDRQGMRAHIHSPLQQIQNVNPNLSAWLKVDKAGQIEPGIYHD
jgi:hypothetical protein